MPKVSFDLRTAVPPERVMAMLTDFSPNRPEIWPMLAPELYEVHRARCGQRVCEGRGAPSRAAFGSETIMNGRRIGCAGPCVTAITASPAATSKSAFVWRQTAALGCTWIGGSFSTDST